MDCNRDEAIRAKEIAERKFQAKDIKGAKKFALKAQNLYPELEGISQMLMTLEVYLSAEEKKILGESNWYGVLGVTPFAEDEVIRKQFRKLALLLHPDKNKCIGAEGAFQLVSQAWSFLSDKSKRVAYDQRFGPVFQQRNQKMNGPDSLTPAQNGFYNFAKNVVSQVKVPKNHSSNRDGDPKCFKRKDRINKDESGKDISSGPPPTKNERHTFWTVCHKCKMQYEYLRMYLNHHLLCPNCQEAYFAIEIMPPSKRVSKTLSQTNYPKQWQHSNNHGHSAAQKKSTTPHGLSYFSDNNTSKSNHVHWTPFSNSIGSASAVQAANMVKQAYGKVKRERQNSETSARREEAIQRRFLSSKRKMGASSSVHSDGSKRRKGAENFVSCKETIKSGISESGTNQAAKCSITENTIPKRMGENNCSGNFDIKQLLMEKGREKLLQKLTEHVSAPVLRNPTGEEVHDYIKGNEAVNLNDSNWTFNATFCEPMETKMQIPLSNLHRRTFGPYLGGELVEQMMLDVPDPDFTDFEKDRLVKYFKNNQVWAIYDDDNAMPRNYAMIHKVISLNPFQVWMCWLYSVTNSGLGHLNWYLNGFSKTCGEFRLGRPEFCTSLNCFSHEVKWMKCTPETIQIFPRKGDVWALYRNWSFEWNELTEDEVVHKYNLVEVLEGCDEKLGVIVIPLVKVNGFRAIFHRHSNPNEIHRIPVEEMSRFSHQVPFHLLTGRDVSKSLRDCCELDPAAIPLEILQLRSKEKETEWLKTDEDLDVVNKVDCESVIVTP